MNDHPETLGETTIDPVNSLKLFTLGCTALVICVLLAWWRSPITDPVQLAAGLAILVLGCVPGLQWAKHRRPWFPCFEISTLICVVFYAVPLLSLTEGLKNYPDWVLEMSGLLVVGYLGTAVLVFNSIRNPRSAPHWATVKLLPDQINRYLPAGLLINTLYIYLDRFTTLIPYEFLGSIRALCFGLGIITTFIFACEWGRGRLGRGSKQFFVFFLVVQVLLMFSHLYLINGISLLILTAIGYTTTRRRLPWIPIVICLPVIAILHNGKDEMRAIYWKTGKEMPPIASLPIFFMQWTEYGLQENPEQDAPDIATNLANRASLLQMICMSVEQVPALRPHLDGESYIDIPAQVIPRFLWPEKPSSLMSNVRLALYFNLVDPLNPYETSIAFGLISESYVNFGIFGVLMMGALTGLGFKHLALRSVGVPLFSAIGIFMILLTAWSFQAEQVLATWLSSLFQASAISIGVPLLWKKFFGDI
jgi:hypothetical protein